MTVHWAIEVMDLEVVHLSLSGSILIYLATDFMVSKDSKVAKALPATNMLPEYQLYIESV